jgi:nicotinamidase-related amidase
MNSDLGVWTSEDCALVLIDYQKEMVEAIRSETPADLVELHVRWLAKTASAFDVPIVLSTVGVIPPSARSGPVPFRSTTPSTSAIGRASTGR